jgi:hypothetical protein
MCQSGSQTKDQCPHSQWPHFSEVKNLRFKSWLFQYFIITHTSQYHLVVGSSALQFLVRVLFNSFNHSGVACPKILLFETDMFTNRLEGILAFKDGVQETRFGRMSRIHFVPELGSQKSGRYFIVNESNI